MKKLACTLISLSDFSPPLVYNSNILNRMINKLSYQNRKNTTGLHISNLVMLHTCIEVCNNVVYIMTKSLLFRKVDFEKNIRIGQKRMMQNYPAGKE